VGLTKTQDKQHNWKKSADKKQQSREINEI